MPTHNSISKAEIINAFRRFFNWAAEESNKNHSNADRIRNMSDEELSSFLKDTVFEDGQNMFLCEDYVGTSACDGYQCGDCKAYLHWLRKEVEE